MSKHLSVSESFLLASEGLWDGEFPFDHKIHCRFICTFLYRNINIVNPECETIIESLLDGSPSLEEWLESKHNIMVYNTLDNSKKIQETRKQWLVYLAELYKGKK